MEDEIKNAGEIQSGDTAAPGKADAGAEGEPATDPQADRSKALTQEEVNEIVRERLAKRDRAIFAKYGVSDEAGLDELFAKAGETDGLKAKLSELSEESRSLKEKIAFFENGILPSKEDDVRTYFKGKGIEMSGEALRQVLETHPEWTSAPQTTPKSSPRAIGADSGNGIGKRTEEEEAERMFGVRFVK